MQQYKLWDDSTCLWDDPLVAWDGVYGIEKVSTGIGPRKKKVRNYRFYKEYNVIGYIKSKIIYYYKVFGIKTSYFVNNINIINNKYIDFNISKELLGNKMFIYDLDLSICSEKINYFNGSYSLFLPINSEKKYKLEYSLPVIGIKEIEHSSILNVIGKRNLNQLLNFIFE